MPHALGSDCTVALSAAGLSKLRYLIVSATVTDQLETAVKWLSGSAVGCGVYDLDTWLFCYKANVMACKLLQSIIISML